MALISLWLNIKFEEWTGSPIQYPQSFSPQNGMPVQVQVPQDLQESGFSVLKSSPSKLWSRPWAKNIEPVGISVSYDLCISDIVRRILI